MERAHAHTSEGMGASTALGAKRSIRAYARPVIACGPSYSTPVDPRPVAAFLTNEYKKLEKNNLHGGLPPPRALNHPPPKTGGANIRPEGRSPCTLPNLLRYQRTYTFSVGKETHGNLFNAGPHQVFYNNERTAPAYTYFEARQTRTPNKNPR